MELTGAQFAAVRSVFQDVPDGCVRVAHVWTTAGGTCSECPDPAAFRGDGDRALCAVCAANEAADHGALRWIFND